MEKIETDIEGIVSPSHPPIIGVVKLASSAGALKAGTVLKYSSGSYSAAEDSDTPFAVLVEDVEPHPSGEVNVRVLLHGIAVESRLLNASQAAPNDTLKGKLPGAGIYLTQSVWSESNFN
ncbi:hypothetical protein [Treponema pectinovorum]|uniref:hypothetical protein n=1 Tax=Treponema pectinovorum TaxID=164 RepID=UPI0011CCA814|nr:hypothetical protein [Treponema pectinovorum]